MKKRKFVKNIFILRKNLIIAKTKNIYIFNEKKNGKWKMKNFGKEKKNDENNSKHIIIVLRKFPANFLDYFSKHEEKNLQVKKQWSKKKRFFKNMKESINYIRLMYDW